MIETDKWAFCHIPKNGGTNFTTRSPHKPDKKFNNISRHNPPDCFPEVSVPWIGIVRNPYSRYLSFFFWATKLQSWEYTFEEFVVQDLFRQPETSGDKFISMEFEDTNRKTKSKYMLSDLSVIPTPPELKNLPSEFELGIKVDSYFINTFTSGKSALAEAETFTILTENNETKIVIGYASIASNRVTIPVETTKYQDIEPISFNANMFASILNANKDCESATLEVSSAGLSRIQFSIDNYDSEYFLVSTQAVN